eukprot:1576099-Rhodomonas_salina.1
MALAVVINEFCTHGDYDHKTETSTAEDPRQCSTDGEMLKIIHTSMTFVLVALVVMNFNLSVSLAKAEHSFQQRELKFAYRACKKSVITASMVAKFLLEVLICAIHPVSVLFASWH